MFIGSLLNFGGGSAQITLIASIDETTRPLNALAQSINENSVTQLPASGTYCFNYDGTNMTCLPEIPVAVMMQNPRILFNGNAFTYQAYNSALGNGTGRAAQEGRVARLAAKSGNNTTITFPVVKNKEVKTLEELDALLADASINQQRYDVLKLQIEKATV